MCHVQVPLKADKLRKVGPFESLGDLPERVNVASSLPRRAAETPGQPAVIVDTGRLGAGRWRAIDCASLERRSNRIAGGLAARGLGRDDRVSMFVRPGVDLVAITYALFKLGAVPVLIDPGMGRERLLACVQKMRPKAFLGIPLANLARRLWPEPFTTVELAVSVGRPKLFGAVSLEEIEAAGQDELEPADTHRDDAAAILFTSGSTGPPKGVLYTHGMFDAQIRALRAMYGFQPGEANLAGFPLFALFDVAFGMTSVFPRMDPTRPARCDPRKIVEALEATGATSAFGSPAIWRRVVPWCHENGRRLSSLQRVLVAGAPVPPALVEGIVSILPEGGEVHTPYGATESLPVTSIPSRKLLGALRDEIDSGRGTCVGKAAPGIDLRVIRVSDAPIERWSDDLEVPAGEVGEVCVRGPVVTRLYADDEPATALAKIADGDHVWHRMGDLGFLDEERRLWYVGRKAHRLETREGRMPPVPAENVFNTHPEVRRSAVVGVGPSGRERPVVVVEAVGRLSRTRVTRELLDIAGEHDATRSVSTVLFHPGFPVDPRHNSKIHREELKVWAEERLS